MAYLTFWVVSFIINGQGFTFLLIGHKLFSIKNTTIDLQALKIRLLLVGRTKRIVKTIRLGYIMRPLVLKSSHGVNIYLLFYRVRHVICP